MSNLYNAIAELCEKEGISGYKLCKDLKISPSVLTDLKKGRKKSLSADYAERIATYFGVSVSYLLGNEKTAPEKSEAVSESDMKLIEWFRSLPPEKQRAILTAQDAPEGIV